MKDTMGMIAAALVIVLLGFGAYYLWRTKGADQTPLLGESSVATSTTPESTVPGGPVSQDVVFNATDGYKLSGTYSVPLAGSPIKMPVLVLVHQYQTNRHDFDSLVPLLLDQGYAVLAYDSRGSGASVNGSADKKDYVKDFAGALAFLSTQKEVDPSQVGVIGASVGGNVAFVASGTFPSVKASVALSPSYTGQPKELLGTAVSGFNPHALFVASDDKEKAEADLVFKKAKDPKTRRVYPGAGHGVAILGNDQALQDVISFVAQFLDVKG